MEKINLENYKGIIFDMDGVIYDISEAIKKAVDDSVEKYDMNVNADDVMEGIAIANKEKFFTFTSGRILSIDY